jgi:hypothetical protein
MVDQIIFPTSPIFDAKKHVEAANQKLNINKNFDSYGIGITDVEEKYTDWKYTRQSKPQIFFEKLTTFEIAKVVYDEFVRCGYQPLDYDPLDSNDSSKCRNIFIVRIPKS